jgi:hypothetical protein
MILTTGRIHRQQQWNPVAKPSIYSRALVVAVDTLERRH